MRPDSSGERDPSGIFANVSSTVCSMRAIFSRHEHLLIKALIR
ncbi:hypothetical protein [Streptomyces abyssalis]|nr:hypothetical protein [Streptomyces abyssalis]